MSNNKSTLKKGAIGVIGATVIGVVVMSPAMCLYGNFGPIALSAGKAVPLVFLLGLLFTLPTAICYAVISKEIPSSGSAYTWLWKAVSPAVGVWMGWILVGFYLIVVFLQPLLFAMFFNDLIRSFGLPAGYGTFVAGVVISSIAAAALNYRGVEISERSSLIDVAVQTLIVTALAVTIIIILASKNELDYTPLMPSSSPNGFSGIMDAMIFGVLSFVGFGVVSSMAEETVNPRKTIPIAIILSCVLPGIFWVIVSWAYAIAIPVEQLIQSVKDDIIPVVPIAEKYWGNGNILVILTGMIASLGVYIATVMGVSRTLYAMGRDGSIPAIFGKLNKKHQVPWNAIHLTFLLTFIFTLVPTAITGIYNTYMWWGKAVVFFSLLTYTLVSIANPLFYLKYKKEQFSILWNGVIAFVSLAINLYLMFAVFFTECWQQDWLTGKSVIAFTVVWMLLGVIYTLWLKKRSPTLFKQT
ncbi:MAG: APC family permease [Verrucomicrobiales bacterium]|nr:APC family permease [Verrucomicrobiales bacterium]